MACITPYMYVTQQELEDARDECVSIIAQRDEDHMTPRTRTKSKEKKRGNGAHPAH